MASNRLYTWIIEGIMDPDNILQRLSERVSDYGDPSDEEYIQLKQHFHSLCIDSNGTPSLTKTAFYPSSKPTTRFPRP